MARQKKQKVVKPYWETATADELFRLCSIPWTSEEAAVADINRKSGEGRHEKSRRMSLGLPLDAEKGPVDIPGRVLVEPSGHVRVIEPEELKDADITKNGRRNVTTTFRLGKAKDDVAFGDVVFYVVTATFLVDDGEELITDLIVIGDVKAFAVKARTLRRMPTCHRNRVREMLRPSKVMAHIKWMTITSRHGRISVPAEDFDIAFLFVSTSQARLNYRLDLNYLRNMLRSEHEKQTRNEVVRDLRPEESGPDVPHTTGETIPEQGHLGGS